MKENGLYPLLQWWVILLFMVVYTTLYADQHLGTLNANADKFPIIDLTLTVSLTCDPLAAEHFTVLEAGESQTILEVRPPQTTESIRAADIVFVYDNATSMQDKAAQIKTNVVHFLEALITNGVDFRVALFPFGGNGKFAPAAGKLLNNGNLYFDQHRLISDLDTMAKMGFNGHQGQILTALQSANRQILWRGGAQKIIILITDTNCQTQPENCQDPPTAATLIDELNVNATTVYSFVNLQETQLFEHLARSSGGRIFNLTDDLSEILNAILTIKSKQYTIQYETANTAISTQTKRTVQLDIAALDSSCAELTGIYTTFYTPVPPLEIKLSEETRALFTTGQLPNTPLAIAAKISRLNVATDVEAKLFFQGLNQGFQAVPLQLVEADFYTAFMPAEAVAAPFVSYYLEAHDNLSTRPLALPSEAANQPFTVAVLPNALPTITHVPLTTATTGQTVEISATVTDSTQQVSRVVLFYRNVGQVSYKTLPATFAETVVSFIATIPADTMTVKGLEYYLLAEDDTGAYQTFATMDNPIRINIRPLISHTPITTVQAGEDIVIEATATDVTRRVSQVTLYYRQSHDSPYQAVATTFNQTTARFTAIIPHTAITGKQIYYYLEVVDDTGGISFVGSPKAALEITVVEAGGETTRYYTESGGGCTLGKRDALVDPLLPLLIFGTLCYIFPYKTRP